MFASQGVGEAGTPRDPANLWGKVGRDGDKGGEGVFMGEYRHNLDDKGRLFIPARFRDDLGPRFVITKGLDRCLFLYSGREWEGMEEKLRQLPLTSAEARAFSRFFFAGASDSEPDRQGRIVLPQVLRDYAGIVKEAVIIGVASRVEIWALEQWRSYEAASQASPEDLAEALGKLGLLT